LSSGSSSPTTAASGYCTADDLHSLADDLGMHDGDRGADRYLHASDSVDYGVVLSGRVVLWLASGDETKLGPGACVVQTGGPHAWENRWRSRAGSPSSSSGHSAGG